MNSFIVDSRGVARLEIRKMCAKGIFWPVVAIIVQPEAVSYLHVSGNYRETVKNDCVNFLGGFARFTLAVRQRSRTACFNEFLVLS